MIPFVFLMDPFSEGPKSAAAKKYYFSRHELPETTLYSTGRPALPQLRFQGTLDENCGTSRDDCHAAG